MVRKIYETIAEEMAEAMETKTCETKNTILIMLIFSN